LRCRQTGAAGTDPTCRRCAGVDHCDILARLRIGIEGDVAL
jgi:hypothetical protein